MDYLPLFFQLKQRPVLLVGGGAVALRKANLLLKAGCHLQVVAPEISDDLLNLLQQHQAEAILDNYQEKYLKQQSMVIAATDNNQLNLQIYTDATAANLPINVVDQPELCSFIFPAIVDRSPVVIAISSGGKAPVLARMLRAKLETWIPSKYSDLSHLVGRFREAVKQRFSTLNQRRMFWESVLAGQVAERVFVGRLQEAEKLLQTKLEQDSSTSTGEVYLVGGGPGDPELLTFKALRLMQQADVVLYDALISEEVLNLCRRDAELIFVGKKRDKHQIPQEELNQLIIDLAQQGKRVLRLKGGDPFIFGRGAEELQPLKKLGIPFQVVPGITAASACSSYAGIPLTHREYSQSVRLVTGQLKNRTSDLNFDELVIPNQTLVFYMGLHSLEHLAEQLIAHGMKASIPAAVISRGTQPNQQVITGSLDNIAQLKQEANLASPALIIVGEVVSLHEDLSWFGNDFLQQQDLLPLDSNI